MGEGRSGYTDHLEYSRHIHSGHLVAGAHMMAARVEPSPTNPSPPASPARNSFGSLQLCFWDSATCLLPSPCLPSPWGRAHMRTTRQRRTSSVLTATFPMATSTTCAPGPDFPVQTRQRQIHLLNCNPVYLPLPVGFWVLSSRPSCNTGCGTTHALTSPPALTFQHLDSEKNAHVGPHEMKHSVYQLTLWRQ